MWILLLAFFVILLLCSKFIFKKVPFSVLLIGAICIIVINCFMVYIDFSIQTTDYEIWSGQITSIVHKEEWDEFHPPTRNSDGDLIPGKWEHHKAENIIKTSDNGSYHVTKSPDGKMFTDRWPNTTEELYAYWQVGMPTSSIHRYKNLVQASDSLFKHEGIDVKDFPNLPEYPKYQNNYFVINRLLGEVPNKEAANYRLNEWNSYLNKRIPDPNQIGKTKSYKEVNVIFVNLGDVEIKNAYALQEKWENGNKNDYNIAFSMSDDGTINWVYPFSWTDVELLRIEIRDKMLDIKQTDDFVEVIDDVCSLIEQLFERKQMAEFDYLQINPSTWVYWVNGILSIIMMFITIVFLEDIMDEFCY